MLCCSSSLATYNQHQNKYLVPFPLLRNLYIISHCFNSSGCRALFRCPGPLSARSLTPPSTMGLCWLLHQVFLPKLREQYFLYESLSSGSNLPHAAITEALSPALKLDKAAESKVGISLCLNHASSPIKQQVCNTALSNSLVSCFSTLSFFLLSQVHNLYC